MLQWLYLINFLILNTQPVIASGSSSVPQSIIPGAFLSSPAAKILKITLHSVISPLWNLLWIIGQSWFFSCWQFPYKDLFVFCFDLLCFIFTWKSYREKKREMLHSLVRSPDGHNGQGQEALPGSPIWMHGSSHLNHPLDFQGTIA